MKCLSEIAPTNQVRQSFQELADMNRGAVKVEEAFGKTAIAMMLQPRIGHINNPPFWM